MSMMRGLFAVAAAGALSLPMNPPSANLFRSSQNSGHHRAAGAGAPPIATLRYQSNQLEYYLTDAGVSYIRPGVQLKINSVTIPADKRPVVDFNITDGNGQPLDRLGNITPGAVSPSFILASWDPTTRDYTPITTRTQTTPPSSPHPGVSAVQGSTDSGAFTDLEMGHATYKFKTALPATDDPAKTHTLGVYATRNLTDTLGKNYYVNVEYDFRPDGQKVTDQWAEINQATSCNNCHDPLSAHGGARRDVKLCVLCHNPTSSDPDTGNTVDFKVMIHKIHDGVALPSVRNGTPYQIIGFNQGLNDFSTVEFPQDIRNCQNCHEGTDPAKKPAMSNTYFTNPSATACGSCHDDVNFTTGANHPAGPQPDSACAKCHTPDSGKDWDATILAAHTVPEKASQLKGLSASIVSVSNFAPGQKPTVVFAIKNGDGSAVDGTKLTSFAPMYNGPTSSYATQPVREAAQTKATFDATSGNTTYTFSKAIPADATGTWVVSADIYRNVTLTRNDGKQNIYTWPTIAAATSVREAAFNPIKYMAITGTVTPRRQVVALSNCNTCHDRLALHGGQRLNTEECVICHNPNANDAAQRPANAGAPESISFQRLVHRIHSGENLTQDFTIFGFGGSKNTFNDVRFPGDRRDCAKCHVGTTFIPPVPTGVANVITLRDYFSPQGPTTASCLGCHDNQDAAAHAYLNTTNFGNAGTTAEACATCHSAGKDWAVDKVHAR